MGVTKTEIFSARQNKLATILKALAHPARIAIIQHLIKSETCFCGNIVEELGLAQATTSQHLKELKNIGLIKSCIEGTSVSYCIDAEVWQHVKKELDAFFVAYKIKGECC